MHCTKGYVKHDLFLIPGLSLHGAAPGPRSPPPSGEFKPSLSWRPLPPHVGRPSTILWIVFGFHRDIVGFFPTLMLTAGALVKNS